MKKILPFACTVFLVLLSWFSHIAADDSILTIDNFDSGISPLWKEKKFNGVTKYSPTQIDSKSAVLAESENSASGLFLEIEYNPVTYPILEWSWQVEAVLEKGDARHKKGDDYAARIYVVFPSIFFWRTRALNYIWANTLPKGEFCDNAYTSNNVMISVQSGNKNAGKWINEQRNIVEDFKRAFGVSPPSVGAIAIMTDTDDTGESARAWYGNIRAKKLFLAPGESH